MNRVSWVPLGFGLLAMAGAVSAFNPAFDGTRWAIALGAAIVVAMGVMAWSVATRTGLLMATLLSAVACVFVTTATVLSGTLGESVTTTLRDFLDGVTTGWNDALQEDMPLVRPTLPLIWVTVTTWIASGIAGRALAAGRATLPALLAPAVMLAMATAVTVPAGSIPWVPVVCVAIGLLGILGTTAGREIDLSWGQVRATALVMILATTAGLVATNAASGDTEGAWDPRSLRSDDATREEVPDLLAQLDEIITSEPATALQLQVIDGARPTRLRLAVYDSYDGEKWRTSTTYRELLQFTPPAVPPPGEPSTVQIQLVNTPGPWLPMLDRVNWVRPTVRGWDAQSQTALYDASITTVDGTILTPGLISSVAGAEAEVDERFIAVPAATPANLLDMAATAAADTADARAAVRAITDAVLELGRDDTVPSGHSLGRLSADVETLTPMAPEQLVTLHALLVRSVGVPSRIVVGYRVGDNDDIATTDLRAWTEVAFAGVGWVPFDPIPAEQVPREGTEGEVPGSTTTLPGQSITQAQVVPRELDPGERNPDEFTRTEGSGVGWAEIGIGIAGLVVALILGIVIARRVRRRGRRKATSAPWSIAGAWGELLDRLREAAAPSPPNRTIEEAMDQVEEMAPDAGGSLREFSKLVNVTLYSEYPPDWDDAEHAWYLLEDIETHLRSSRGRSVRFKAVFDPRSLRHPTPRPAPNRARRPHPPRPRRTDHPRVQR